MGFPWSEDEFSRCVSALSNPASVAVSAVLTQFTGQGKDEVIDDGLLMLLEKQMYFRIFPDIYAVDFLSSVLAPVERTYIKVVVKNALYRGGAPGVLRLSLLNLDASLIRVISVLWGVVYFCSVSQLAMRLYPPAFNVVVGKTCAQRLP